MQKIQAVKKIKVSLSKPRSLSPEKKHSAIKRQSTAIAQGNPNCKKEVPPTIQIGNVSDGGDSEGFLESSRPRIQKKIQVRQPAQVSDKVEPPEARADFEAADIDFREQYLPMQQSAEEEKSLCVDLTVHDVEAAHVSSRSSRDSERHEGWRIANS